MEYFNDLYELCETISNEIADANEKIRAAGGKVNAGDVDYIDKLTHSLKSIKATIKMMEDEDGGYSGNDYDDGNGGNGSYRGYSRNDYARNDYRYSNRGRSYARGRGSNAKRDSMGRYASRDYSREGDLVGQLHDMMQDAPNEQVKREMQRLAEKLEQQM